MTADASATLAATEQTSSRTADLDRLSVRDLVGLLQRELAESAALVEMASGPIATAITLIADRLGAGGSLIYVGAGTSGRLGALDASEIPPTFGADPGLVRAVIAGGRDALTAAVEGAEDDEPAGRADIMAAGAGPGMVVAGIAASGATPYVRAALAQARAAGADTILVCNVEAPEAVADIVISVPTGAEPLAGSTRLRAGTAQKVILNLLTTGAMVLLGRTYGNLMVNVQPANRKLKGRAVRLVMQIAGASQVQAEAALASAAWDVRIAVVALKRGVTPEAARERLAATGGRLRQALE